MERDRKINGKKSRIRVDNRAIMSENRTAVGVKAAFCEILPFSARRSIHIIIGGPVLWIVHP